jgi:RNA ligase partner protein
MIMEKFVLDTNLFFNMEIDFGFEKKTEAVVVGLTNLIKRLKKNNKAEFFLPPRVVDEFLSFFSNKEQAFIKDFLSIITVKSPNYEKIFLSADIFLKLVIDVRQRTYRGAALAEEEIINAARLMLGKQIKEKKYFEIETGEVVRRFRERYRRATRFGFLDSAADLDLIILAKEIDGFLVSSDEGVINWGRLFGVKELNPSLLRKRFEELMIY